MVGSLAPEPPEEALFPSPLALAGTAGRVAAVLAWVGVGLFLVGLVAAVASWCCGSAPPGGFNASSDAGSPQPPPPRSPPSA